MKNNNHSTNTIYKAFNRDSLNMSVHYQIIVYKWARISGRILRMISSIAFIPFHHIKSLRDPPIDLEWKDKELIEIHYTRWKIIWMNSVVNKFTLKSSLKIHMGHNTFAKKISCSKLVCDTRYLLVTFSPEWYNRYIRIHLIARNCVIIHTEVIEIKLLNWKPKKSD